MKTNNINKVNKIIKIIIIDENTRAIRKTDNLQWIAEERKISGEYSKKPGEEKWITLGYFTKLRYLVCFLLERCDDSISGDIKNLINSFNSAADKIIAACDAVDTK